MNPKQLETKRGFVALTSVLVVSFLVLAVATSISLLGVGEAKNSLDFRRGQEALVDAQGCLDEALLRIRNDPSYTGSSSITGLNCNISVSGSGIDRTILVESIISSQPRFVKKIEITTKGSGNSINITSWREVE